MKCEIHNEEMEQVPNWGKDESLFVCKKCNDIHNKAEKKFIRDNELGNYPIETSDREAIRKECKCRECVAWRNKKSGYV